MTQDSLPEHNKLVVAFLDGTKHHSGLAWKREGWAFMVRWKDCPEHTVANEWARRHYDDALKEIGADYADIVEWVYVSDLSKFSTKVAGHENETVA